MTSRLTNILPETNPSPPEPDKPSDSPEPHDVESSPDAGLLRSARWADDAPHGMARAAAKGDVARFVKRWRRQLPQRSVLRRLAGSHGAAARGTAAALFDDALFAAMGDTSQQGSALLREHVGRLLEVERPSSSSNAAAASDVRRNGHASAVEEPPQPSRQESAAALMQFLSRPSDAGGSGAEIAAAKLVLAPVDALVLCDLLLFEGRDAADDVCFAAWSAVVGCVSEHASVLTEPAGCDATALTQAALSGELLWKAGLLFAGLADAVDWREAGRQHLQGALESWSDAAGRPAADAMPGLASAIGVAARSAAWGAAFGTALWGDESSSRFAAWVRTSIGMCQSGAQIALGEASHATALLLDFAAHVAGVKGKSRPRRLLAALVASDEGEPVRGKLRRSLEEDVSESKRASFQSDETRVACLRTNWSPKADLVAIRHDAAMPTIDISLRGQPVFRGAWELDVRRNGRLVEFAPEWKATCWFSDDDADYLELQQILADGTHIERQLLLSRKLHCLVLADCVSHTGDEALELRSRLPVVTGLIPHNETATRECWLERDVLAVRAFPLALEDDRLHRANGSLIATDFAIELRQTSSKGLFAPLVLDWNPKRANAPADWRKLTVSEDGKSVGIGHASGHRLRIGDHQIVVYRSLLRNDELRTVLGYHTAHETMIGLFDKDGDIQPLVLVE